MASPFARVSAHGQIGKLRLSLRVGEMWLIPVKTEPPEVQAGAARIQTRRGLHAFQFGSCRGCVHRDFSSVSAALRDLPYREQAGLTCHPPYLVRSTLTGHDSTFPLT